ncbi:MAG: DUF1810 domain-containing protein [Bacteroidales bacterium]|jgi:uncharacterized protein (DUF1810 family)|nr:DUF1810 domain-containing protein [Bacteroidales bacterium]
MEYDLQRFRKAQDEGNAYKNALKEIGNGLKTGHWMWYVFPQLRGLGKSSMAMYYGIIGKGEAKAYLADKVLGGRLREICNSLVQVRGKSAADIFGPVDTMKLRSSMTLFYLVSGKEEIFRKVLARYFDEKLDQKTVDML